MQRIVSIGGGTGLFTVLEGLKGKADLTAIVTSLDSGGSSGKLRDEFGVLPFGDLRRCLVALSDSEQIMRDLFEYRYKENGSLKEHVFGNIFMLTLLKVTGSYEKAIEEIGKILAINGKVYPCTLENVNLCAELENGKIIEGEEEIGKYKLYHNTKIKRIFTNQKAEIYEKAKEAILNSDKIILGPGSLYTSIIANLVVDNVAEIIKKAEAKKIYVVNVMTQHGETDDFSASKHVEEIEKYLGKDALDYVILNKEKAVPELLKAYEEEWKYQVSADVENINAKVITGDFLRKTNLLRHDKDKLAEAILSI